MKRIVVFSVLISMLIINYNAVEAAKVNQSKKVKVVQKANEKRIMYENDVVQIVKDSGKYGVIDKNTNQYIVKPILDNITAFSKDNKYEYKIKSGDMLGYMNILTKDSFVSHFDEISIINKDFLKVKKSGNYGIVNKKGIVVVPAEYDRVAVTNYDEVEYLIAKLRRHYNVFYNNGELITPEEFETLGDSVCSSELAKYFNPELKRFLFIPKKKKEVNTDYIIEDTDNYSETTVSNAQEGESVDVEEFPLPPSVKKVAVQQEGYSDVQNNTDEEEISETVDTIALNNKDYYIVNKNGKLGLQNKKGKEIIPAVYTVLKAQTFNNKEVIAVKGDKNSKIYDTKGNVIAVKFNDRVCIYTNLRKYEYYKNEGIYNVAFNNRKVGELEILPNGGYEYRKVGFNLSNMKKANELFMNFLEIMK